jgi:DUF1680 family protein
MERVLYNTIAGATPILADGTSFYYSDYNNSAHKGHHRDNWPCCSGTFPQLTADYGISSYYRGQDGIYVNLFVPSRVAWPQNNTRCTLTQTTQYPSANATQLTVGLARPESFTVYLRVPAWAGSKTSISINGRLADKPIEPGKFLALQRTWKDGDRIEFEMEMPLRLEAVDDQSPNVVALVRGPVALFAAGDIPEHLTRKQLLSATAPSQTSDDWIVKADHDNLTLRPFASIMSENYRLYQRVEG